MLTKVYNKGIRPIVYLRTLRGVQVLHPKKFDLVSEETAKAMIAKFPDAVSEADYKKPTKKKTRPVFIPEAID